MTSDRPDLTSPDAASALLAVAAEKKTRDGGIQSLERASAILDAVARRPEGINLAAICTEVGLHTSTAFHLIKTLVKLGFLSQSADNKQYRIGRHLFMLAAGALDENALVTAATPALERLSAVTGQAAHLAVLADNQVVVLARTAATGMLQLVVRNGATRPPHATAIGKTLLAGLPPTEFDRLLETLPMQALTPHTITDREVLRSQVVEARKLGIAFDDRELDMDVRCMAVPVRDFSGRCAGAMGISVPAWRLSQEELQAKAGQLREIADALSAELGYDAARIKS
jgi:DNA-binding IclR family transcriptional regulator